MDKEQIETPLVSVIMPVKNVESYIFDAVQSVLNSDYKNLELLCIDDNSSDKTNEVIDSIDDSRIRIIKNYGSGYVDGVNTGIKLATGTYIMSADGDDLVDSSRISKQVSFLGKRPEFGAICGDFKMLTPESVIIDSKTVYDQPLDITQHVRSGEASVSHCSYLIRRQTMQMLDYRRWFITASDLDFQFRLAEKTSIWYMPGTTFYYRLHASSITHTQPNNQREFFERTARLFIEQRKVDGQDDLDKQIPPQIPEADKTEYPSSIHISNAMIGSAWRLKNNGLYLKAVMIGFKSWSRNPTDTSLIKSVLALILKPRA